MCITELDRRFTFAEEIRIFCCITGDEMYLHHFQTYLQLFEPREAYISELRLQHAWKEELWKRQYISGNGRTIRVICPGKHNFSDGPDFLDARVFIGDKLYSGDIEIHHYAADWYAHGHHKDASYKHCVLHVVFYPPGNSRQACRENGKVIPVCYIPVTEVFALPRKEKCLVFYADPKQYFPLLMDYGWHRVEQKVSYFYQHQSRLPHDIMLYWGVFKACGYQYNKENMIRLFLAFPWEDYHARRIPEKTIAQHLLQLAGFTKNGSGSQKIRWFYSGTRPAHFPDRRVAWLGGLLGKHYGKSISNILYRSISENASWHSVFNMFFDVPSIPYWQRHYQQGNKTPKTPTLTPGLAIQQEIILNTIIPLMEAIRLKRKDKSGIKIAIREYISNAYIPHPYGIVQKFHQQHGISKHDARQKNWLASQGVLYIKDNFCTQELQSCCPICAMADRDKKTP